MIWEIRGMEWRGVPTAKPVQTCGMCGTVNDVRYIHCQKCNRELDTDEDSTWEGNTQVVIPGIFYEEYDERPMEFFEKIGYDGLVEISTGEQPNIWPIVVCGCGEEIGYTHNKDFEWVRKDYIARIECPVCHVISYVNQRGEFL